VAHHFEFGRGLPVGDGDGDAAEIEPVDTVGDGDVSTFAFSGPSDQLDGRVEDPFVDVDGCRLEVLETFDGREFHVAAWDPNADPFFRLVDDHGGSGVAAPALESRGRSSPLPCCSTASDTEDDSNSIQQIHQGASRIGCRPVGGEA